MKRVPSGICYRMKQWSPLFWGWSGTLGGLEQERERSSCCRESYLGGGSERKEVERWIRRLLQELKQAMWWWQKWWEVAEFRICFREKAKGFTQRLHMRCESRMTVMLFNCFSVSSPCAHQRIMNIIISTFQEKGMRIKRKTLPRDEQTVISRKANKWGDFLAVRSYLAQW